MLIPTGGSWAVSPTKLTGNQFLNKHIPANRRAGFHCQKLIFIGISLEIIDASSTINQVFLNRFLSRTNRPEPSADDCCRYIFYEW
jgi:hypothetical protein